MSCRISNDAYDHTEPGLCCTHWIHVGLKALNPWFTG